MSALVFVENCPHRVDQQLLRFKGLSGVPHQTGQVLPEKRGLDDPAVECFREPRDGILRRGVVPVVANTIGIGVVPQDMLLSLRPLIVAFPVAGVLPHQRVHHGHEVSARVTGDGVACDQVKSVECFPKCEGQFRPDLEDGEAVLDEFAERLRALIVSRMRLIDKRGLLVEQRGKGLCSRPVVER